MDGDPEGARTIALAAAANSPLSDYQFKAPPALELCISQHVHSIRQQAPFPEAEPTGGNPAIYFQPNEVLANVGYPGSSFSRNGMVG
jgi:hypothetical protein